MPELPEVEALCRSFDTRLQGRLVAHVVLRSVAVLKTFDPQITALQGLTFDGCVRRGKFIDLSLPPLHLVVHLARGGWMTLREKPTNARPSLRGPLALMISLADGASLEVTEFGKDKRLAVYVVRDPMDVPGVARLGIDALDPALGAPQLRDLLREQRGTLKSVLSDQAVIAGIGNAYSDEILHAARLSPLRHANALDDEEVERLALAIKDILNTAVALAVATDPAALKDGKRQSMRVHGRTGEACPVCGDTVREVSLATRSFQYCPTCQSGGRIFADRRMSRLLPLTDPVATEPGDVSLERALWALRAYDTIALATSSTAGPHVAGVFFAPEQTAGGIRLLIATRGGSRLHRELQAEPRVAFMCSPGNASRWIQGGGVAAVVIDHGARTEITRRLIEHAAGAQQYVEAPDMVPVTIAVRWLKVVEARDGAHLLLRFDG